MGNDNYKIVVMEYQLPSVPNPGGRDSDGLCLVIQGKT